MEAKDLQKWHYIPAKYIRQIEEFILKERKEKKMEQIQRKSQPRNPIQGYSICIGNYTRKRKRKDVCVVGRLTT